ncbi:MAG: Holliday junction branch migration DNA helicase RuvB, partial [Pseudomonadota bacterium]
MIEADRLIAPENPSFREEDVIDRAIRPKKLADYQGQD